LESLVIMRLCAQTSINNELAPLLQNDLRYKDTRSLCRLSLLHSQTINTESTKCTETPGKFIVDICSTSFQKDA